MRIPSDLMGGVGLTRLACDHCSKPVEFCWKGRNGEYCSKACRDKGAAAKAVVTTPPPPAAPIHKKIKPGRHGIERKSLPTLSTPQPKLIVKRGSAGGQARAAKLTEERRKEIARKAIAARWGK